MGRGKGGGVLVSCARDIHFCAQHVQAAHRMLVLWERVELGYTIVVVVTVVVVVAVSIDGPQQALPASTRLTGTVLVGNRSRVLAQVDRQTGTVNITSSLLPYNPQCE